VGTQFRDWYEETYKPIKLAKNEAYCASCKKPVQMVNPTENSKDGLTYLLSSCPDCGRKVPKILTMKRR
jgi:DNA-directed RNA polymerase subunit RPC12/RpoP